MITPPTVITIVSVANGGSSKPRAVLNCWKLNKIINAPTAIRIKPSTFFIFLCSKENLKMFLVPISCSREKLKYFELHHNLLDGWAGS